MRRAGCMAAFMCALAGTGALAYGLAALPTASASASDPYCIGAYGGAAPSSGAARRFGVDPGIAGSAGGTQLPSAPDDPAKDLSTVCAVVPPRPVPAGETGGPAPLERLG